MKYDKKIERIIRDIKFSSDCYLEDIEVFNECATTDRIIESIIAKAKDLEKYHKQRSESNKETEKKKKDRSR